MNEKISGINFGVGVFETKKGLDDEQIKNVIEKIDQETKAAGLPWWAGMFHPEIVKMANIEKGQCNCAKDEPEIARCSETDEKPEGMMEERQFREMEEQRERLRRADGLVIQAICMEVSGMERLAEMLKSEDTKSTLALEVARNIAEAGNVVARLRGSMSGAPVYGFGV